jgi:hypothetical protein
VSQRFLKVAVAVSVLAAASVAIPVAASAATPRIARCALSGTGHIQICPVSFKAVAGKSAHVVVARYADFSGCNLPAPSNEPGENQNYVVASVTINWGDHTRTTSGIAHTGKGCIPTDSPDTDPGLNEPVTGVHRYKKMGTYRVSVSLTYVRGKGDTYPNCASATRGDTVYNHLTNCIALNAPVASVAVVKKR